MRSNYQTSPYYVKNSQIEGHRKTLAFLKSVICAPWWNNCVSTIAHALEDAKVALKILTEIIKTRSDEREMSILADPRFIEFKSTCSARVPSLKL